MSRRISHSIQHIGDSLTLPIATRISLIYKGMAPTSYAPILKFPIKLLMSQHYPTSPKARRRSNQYLILLRFESGEEPSSLLFLRPRRVEKETRVQKSLCRRIETLNQCLPVVLEPAEPLSMMSFCTPSIKDWGFDWSTSQLPFVHKYYLILSLPIRVSANSRNEQKARAALPRIFMSISSSPFR